jgi:large subunit ribosomal protein L2
MGLIYCKPTTNGRRNMVIPKHEKLHKGKPFKALTKGAKSSGGRNNNGRITVRHRGGGVKRLHRFVDFKRTKDGVPAKVVRLEYDPNRTAHLALLSYADGQYAYMLATSKLEPGMIVQSGTESSISEGNFLPLAQIPVGTIICCLEMKPLKGSQIARSAGAYAQLLGKEGRFAIVRLRSGEVRKVHLECRAVIGIVGNAEHSLEKIGTAGRKRRKGIRPTVRGVAMNPVDHPLGGGEGRSSGGRPSCSPTGLPKGKRTRKASKNKGTSMIIRTRHQSKDKKR